MAERFEPLHATLALARRPMGVLTPVVQMAALAMFHPRQDLPLRGTIALQFIRDDDPWDVLTPFEQFTEELLGGLLVAAHVQGVRLNHTIFTRAKN